MIFGDMLRRLTPLALFLAFFLSQCSAQDELVRTIHVFVALADNQN